MPNRPTGTPGRPARPGGPIRSLTWPAYMPEAMAEDLRPLREEHARVSEGLSAARSRLSDLDGRRRQEAIQKDERAAVAAIRAGKDIPPPKAVEALDRDVEEAERAVARYSAAVAAIARDVVALLGEKEEAYTAAILSERSETASEATRALDALTDAVTRLQGLDGTAAWASTEGRKTPTIDPGIVGKTRARSIFDGFREYIAERASEETMPEEEAVA